MDIQNLVIEVTRKCNMACEHCLRGNAVNLDIKKEYIDSLLSQVESIGIVTFTGGEPSLNVPIMNYFLEQCKANNIYVGSFYIATNGMKVNEDFVLFCLRMYSFCGDKEFCQVEVSNDLFHANEGNFDETLLSGLSFFSKKFENDGYNYHYGDSLIKEGKAKTELGMGRETDKGQTKSKMDLDTFNDSDIYLNCKGEIIYGCDWSYANQRYHKLCNVDELTYFYSELLIEEHAY